MLLIFCIIGQEYLISFSLHLNTFKSCKCYPVKYRDIKTFNCIIFSIKRVNCDDKIILILIVITKLHLQTCES
jgi:hypothetical protein